MEPPPKLVTARRNVAPTSSLLVPPVAVAISTRTSEALNQTLLCSRVSSGKLHSWHRLLERASGIQEGSRRQIAVSVVRWS